MERNEIRGGGKATKSWIPLCFIQATGDRLIDQIVHRLYGLSDDEIAIVEGP